MDRDTEAYIKCYKDYNAKCQKGFGKQVSNVYLFTVTQQSKQICKKQGKKRAEYIRFGACGNAAKSGIVKCMDAMLDSLEDAAKLPNKERIAVACW